MATEFRPSQVSRVTRAIVLAAGLGSRLSEGGDITPKPLRRVAGVPLVVRVLRTLRAAGIEHAVVVVGHCGHLIKAAIAEEPELGLEVSFVENTDYLKKNGVSVLAAAGFIDRECVLTMSDHLYSPELVRRLLAAEIPADGAALAVDYDIPRCFDLDDATKVGVERGLIVRISKELDAYDALDTGVFRIGPSLVAELSRVAEQNGDASLSDGVQALSRRGVFAAVDVGEVRWIDVDTQPALERAEAMLRVFGDDLGDEPGSGSDSRIDPEAIETFAPSWVRAAKPYDEQHFAVAERKGAARMMSNESPFPPSPRVLAAIMDAASRGNHYPGGSKALSDKISRREGLPTGSVLFGAGSTELIDVVIRTFVGPGEEVLLSVPTFSMYEARTRVTGGIPVLVPMTDSHDHDLSGLIRAVNERTKVIFLCSPNNPTGNRMSREDLRRMLRLGLPTVIDEAYFDFENDGSSIGLLAEFPNAMVLRTFSKAFGLAGMRLGYALAHPVVVRLLSRVKVPWNVPAVVLAAAAAALDDIAEFEARREELSAGRVELFDSLSIVPGLAPVPGEGNFVLIDVSRTGQSAERLVEQLLEQGVLIRSLTVHHAAKSYVRVTVGTREQNRRCVRAFERVLGRPVRREPMTLSAAVPSDAE
ncbi:MAG: histidinol-phosphate transaminase [Myxococcales bacterium]|nr:MAG: histidinol-phosphate transaminase [Myxococcales bacterium]